MDIRIVPICFLLLETMLQGTPLYLYQAFVVLVLVIYVVFC